MQHMHLLTKTNYLAYLECPEELWLDKNHPNYEFTEPGPDVLFQREQGNQIDELGAEYVEVIALSAQYSATQQVSLQREFQTPRFEILADVAVEDTSTLTIDIYEVKAATQVRAEHLRDVAFQRMVIESCGYQVGRCYLVHTNKTYQFSGRLELAKLFCLADITDQVAAIFTEVQAEARAASDFINGPAPEPQLLAHCPRKLDCAFIRHHFRDLPEYSIFDIARLSSKKKAALLEQGILDIKDVPADFQLSATQNRQVTLAKQQDIHIDTAALTAALTPLSYPLYFLDYETLATAVPLQKGHYPYQQMLFQYSLHVLAAPGAVLQHYEYLLPDQLAPIQELLASLQAQVGTEGTVIVWNKRFEQSINRAYAQIYPEYADWLLSVNARVFDLMEIFSKGHYRHPGFKGKNSLKQVLPVLCPDLNYDSLLIQNGTAANATWFQWTSGEFWGDEEADIRQALLEYCQLDTLAMVRIWEELCQYI